jgi:hypothetical protein
MVTGWTACAIHNEHRGRPCLLLHAIDPLLLPVYQHNTPCFHSSVFPPYLKLLTSLACAHDHLIATFTLASSGAPRYKRGGYPSTDQQHVIVRGMDFWGVRARVGLVCLPCEQMFTLKISGAAVLKAHAEIITFPKLLSAFN